MGWQWHQLDHMQIICTSLQTDNHASTSPRGWALVGPDGVAPSRMISVSVCVNLPLHHKVHKFSSGTGSPGWSRKKGRKMVVCVCVPHHAVFLQAGCPSCHPTNSVKALKALLIMVALWNRADHYIFALWLLSFFLSFFISSLNLSGRRLDVYHTSTHGVALVRI